MKLKRTNFHYILEMMIDGKEITASQVNGVSNANAYFVELEKKGITQSRWKLNNKGHKVCKMRKIKDFSLAKKFLGR